MENKYRGEKFVSVHFTHDADGAGARTPRNNRFVNTFLSRGDYLHNNITRPKIVNYFGSVRVCV